MLVLGETYLIKNWGNFLSIELFKEIALKTSLAVLWNENLSNTISLEGEEIKSEQNTGLEKQDENDPPRPWKKS